MGREGEGVSPLPPPPQFLSLCSSYLQAHWKVNLSMSKNAKRDSYLSHQSPFFFTLFFFLHFKTVKIFYYVLHTLNMYDVSDKLLGFLFSESHGLGILMQLPSFSLTRRNRREKSCIIVSIMWHFHFLQFCLFLMCEI